MDSTSGIVHNAGTENGELVHLPLEEVRINALIIDISARVTLSQLFVNPSEHATSKAVYHFPVPASAAICAFEMRIGDGRIIKGISKDSKVAAEEFETAIQEGREASLLKWITDDIFTISIGSIPAQQTVETKLVFVMDLMNENTDEIRFHLPMHVGQRYGEIPQDLVESSQPSSHTRLRITADVQTGGRILNIKSPTHSSEITTTQYPTHLNRPSRRRATIKYRSKSFLDRDYILIIEAENLDSPRCFAELEGDPDRKATLALQLAVVPKFNLVSARAQEYIFVVDRSGSMTGNRIETAKRTLSMLLRMLPTNRTWFNIFSFGSHSDCLWEESQIYSQQMLDIATSLVERMEANYGGTEIYNAMHNVLTSRRTDIATAVFLLTDGESHDIDRTTSLVRSVTDGASLVAPLRAYVLGIGDGVSTAMCEGIATAGRGVCLYAAQAEEITSKCARLLRAGRTPFITNVTVDWGLSDEYLMSSSNSVSFSSTSSQRTIRLKSFPVLQQAPTRIDDIHAGVRFTVYAILRLKRIRVPEEVVLRGNLDDTGEPFQFRVPIRGVQLTRSEPGIPTIHTMAAWHLIKEHDYGKAPLPMYQSIPNVSPTNEELREAAIIRLGEMYQIASRYTSFIVDSGRGMDRGRERHADFGDWSSGPQVSRSSSQTASPTATTATSPLSALYADIVSGLGSIFASTSPSTTTMPGEWPENPSPSPSTARDNPDDGYESSDSVRTFTTLSSFLGSDSDWSDWTEPSSPISEEMERRPPPQFIPVRFAPPHLRPPPPPPAPPPRPRTPPPLLPEVVDLVKMQQFDGSYELDAHLHMLVGDAAFNLVGVDEKAWATALSIAYITKQMGNQRELLEDLLQKSLEFLRRGNNENLIARATSLIR